jgi:hypothetical protein
MQRRESGGALREQSTDGRQERCNQYFRHAADVKAMVANADTGLSDLRPVNLWYDGPADQRDA